MKKLFILGAGIYQVPLIKAAKKLGYYTIVTSIPGNYPGFEFADKVYYENTTDYETLLKIAKEEQIDGVLTAGTDVAVISEGYIAEQLGLVGPSFETAQISSDKLRMKRSYEEYGVRTARYRGIQTDDENYADKIADLEFPLMFKSVDSSGSRGIVKVNSPDEFEAARNTVLANTRTDHFVVEEFVEGEEFGAQAFIQDGKLEFILPHGDYIMQGDAGVPYGHYAPYDLPDEVIEDVYNQTEMALKAMKCENCALNADYIIKDGKVYVLEIGARGGGACLMDLTSIYFDFGYEDGVGGYHEMIVRQAMGEHIDFFPEDSAIVKEGIPVYSNGRLMYIKGGVANASRMMRSSKDGVITSLTDEHEDHPDIVSVQFDYKVGDEVRKFRVSPDRLGHVITKGKTLDDAVALLNKTMDSISIVVE